MSTKDLLEQRRAHLTPAQRAALERRLRGEPSPSSASQGILRRQDTGPAPLSFSQQRLWLLDTLQPGNPAFNLPAAVRLTGVLDEAALVRSLEEVLARHEIIRTIFEEVSGAPRQRSLPVAPLPLVRVELSERAPEEREAELRGLVLAEAGRPFELHRGPLLRATLFRLGAREHVLLLVMHHIISDGWSMGVLVREVATLYRAFATGQPSPLPPLPLQYADFAAWQRGAARQQVLEAQLDWWKRQLAGAPAVLELPTDHPRPPVRTFRGGAEARVLPRPLVEALTALGKREGSTLFMVLLAALQVVLQRYSGQHDVLVGSPIAGRTRHELEGLIGFFINTLVLRADLSEDPGFDRHLQRVRETALGAYAHQDFPFERLVEELRPERDLRTTPLFQVMFALQNMPTAVVELAGLELEPLEVDSGHVQFDLTWLAVETADGLKLKLHYNHALFLPETAARMLDSFRAVLEAVVREPAQRVSRLPLMLEHERTRLLQEWNGGGRQPPPDVVLPALVEAQVARSPEAVAVLFEGRRLSYRELDRRANALALRLRELGVGPEVPVALCLERALELPLAILAVLKAGGVYVPLDPAYPRERLAFVLRDTGAPVLLTQKHLEALGTGLGARVLCLDDEALLGAEAEAGPDVRVAPGRLAYILYTSGSTGQPKGVMVAHRELCALLSWRNQTLGLGLGDRVLACIPHTFDPSLWGLLGPLLTGASVCITRPGGHQDSAYLVATIAREGLTHLDFALPGLQALLQEPGVEGLRTVRHVFCGGDAMPPELPARLRERLGAVTLFNQYGPTEAVVDATSWPCPSEGVPRTIPIGRPIAHKRIYLLDAHLQPVPVGVPGELYIGGAGLARGYLRQPGLTAERFLADPFSTEPGARMYRTGDLARALPDGNIEFLGRADGQVKLRGQRIELGEIEAVLRRHPAVADGVVVPWESERGRQLVAYCVPAAADIRASELRRFLREHLPEYMIPSAFTLLPALPLSAHGKVDRRALPPPELSRREEDRALVPPRTPLEERIGAVFREVLRVEAVGVEDHFFELGGHSLLAVKVVARLREALRMELPLRLLFEQPTIAGLAERIEQARLSLPEGDGAPLSLASREQALPLAPAQERLWRQARGRPGTAEHNVPLAVRLRGRLEAGALERSLQEIVHRHEALRTTFHEQEGQGVQRVRPPGPLPLALVSLAHLSPEEREAAARRHMAEEAGRPFELASGPLLRGTLVRLDEADHLLLVTLHRLAYDGASLSILLQELAALYRAFGAGLSPTLAPLPAQYAEFALWQRGRLEGEALESRLSYWRGLLEGFPEEVGLPGDHPRTAEPSSRGASESLRLPAALTEQLRELGRREGVTLYMTLLGAFQVLLREYGGREEVVVGSPAANRGRAEFEGLIGRFVNMLVLRGRVAPGARFRELLQEVRATVLAAFAHQDVPAEAVLERLRPGGEPRQAPLWRVVFNLISPAAERMNVGGLEVEALAAPEVSSEFDLTLFAEERGAELELRFVYRAELFEARTIRGLLERLRGLLEGVVEEPGRTLEELSRARAPTPRPAASRPAHAGSVIVLGGGLVGSLLSIFLARRGYQVDVYERFPDARLEEGGERGRQGNPNGKPAVNLTLCTRGFRALDAVGVGDAVRSAAVAARQRIAHAVDGTLLHQPYGNSGEALYSILRGDLNKLLLTFAEREPNVRLHFNKRCLGADLSAPAVRVEDTVTGEVSVHTAQRLIGADGAFSAVRTQMQRLSRFNFSQEYVAHGYRELHCPAEVVGERLERHALHFWPRGHSMLMGQPNRDGSFTLTLHMPFEGEPSFASIATEQALRALFETHFADALPLLPHLTRDYFARPPTSLITIRCSSWIHQDKVALIGDAAHAIVPFYGQGANFGFEDCYVLDRCLSQHGEDWGAALRAYEQERRPNAQIIADLSLEHLTELRDRVGDQRFQLRKAVERKISRMYPGRFASLYALITFEALSCAAARRVAQEQQVIVDRIMSLPDVERRWDGPEVEALIHELMRQEGPGTALLRARQAEAEASPRRALEPLVGNPAAAAAI